MNSRVLQHTKDAGLRTAAELKRKIVTRAANVAVVGLGYVGLPLAVEKAKVGFHVLGIEQNPKRAYPERVDPGNKRYTTKNTSKVMGGVTPACLDVAYTFYAQTIQHVVPVSSPAVAEMTKVFENTCRAVNIALVGMDGFLDERTRRSSR